MTECVIVSLGDVVAQRMGSRERFIAARGQMMRHWREWLSQQPATQVVQHEMVQTLIEISLEAAHHERPDA